MLKLLHCGKDADEWDAFVKTKDPHYSSAYYRAFDQGGTLAVFEGAAQPFHFQENGWIGNAYNFGGPIGDAEGYHYLDHFFREWKNKNALKERCTLNPFQTEQVAYLDTEELPFYREKEVVVINLENQFDLRQTTRHCVSKAIKNGANTWQAESTVSNASAFEKIYNNAMQSKDAAKHWIYPEGTFYKILNELGPARSSLFFTSVGGKVESGCILIFGGDVCYYHWAARKGDMKDIGIDHLQVWSTAHWAQALHFKKFCLGGGLNGNDGLFTFKAGFSRLRAICRSYVTLCREIAVA